MMRILVLLLLTLAAASTASSQRRVIDHSELHSPVVAGAADFVEDCRQLYYLGAAMTESPGEREKGYDTLKHFVYTCTPGNSFTTYIAFNPMNSAIQYMGGEMTRYLEYRHWLKSVLYLNSVDPKYYCKAVEAITFTYLRDGSYSHNLKAQRAIVQYLLESGKCDMDRDILLKAFDEMQAELYKRWRDTTTADTNLVTMDTTLPTLEDLDLEILRGPEFADVQYNPDSPALLNVIAVTNPFTTSTVIEYSLGSTAQVQLSLYNPLGQVVWNQPFGFVQEARTHRFEIGTELEPGSYFFRVATLTNDVRTVKLIKQ